MKICIDPGHGGKDPGAIGPTGLKEKDITLAVAKKLQQKLSSIAKVTLTREVDESRDLWERSSLANSIGADYFISIHCNSAANQTANGTETLIYKTGGKAEKLAAKVQEKVVRALGTSDRGIKTRPGLHVLARTNMPAILVELAFISNPNEEKLLSNSTYQQKAAHAIAEGIANYLGIKLEEDNEKVELTKVIYKGYEMEGFIKSGKTYVEVRKLCEAFGKKVDWNSQKKIVEVKD